MESTLDRKLKAGQKGDLATDTEDSNKHATAQKEDLSLPNMLGQRSKLVAWVKALRSARYGWLLGESLEAPTRQTGVGTSHHLEQALPSSSVKS